MTYDIFNCRPSPLPASAQLKAWHTYSDGRWLNYDVIMRHYASAAYNDPDPDYWPDPGPVMDLFAIKVLNESIDPSLWIYSAAAAQSAPPPPSPQLPPSCRRRHTASPLSATAERETLLVICQIQMRNIYNNYLSKFLKIWYFIFFKYFFQISCSRAINHLVQHLAARLQSRRVLNIFIFI